MSQRKVDPINLLRDAFTSGSKISLVDGLLVFGATLKLPLETPTAWQPPDNSKRYTLGDLWLFLDSKTADAYYPRVAEFRNKLQMVSMSHQSKLSRGDRGVLHGQERLHRLHQ